MHHSIHQGKTKAKLRVQIKKENHKRIKTYEVAKMKPTVKNVRNVLFRCVVDVASTQQKLLNEKMDESIRN